MANGINGREDLDIVAGSIVIASREQVLVIDGKTCATESCLQDCSGIPVVILDLGSHPVVGVLPKGVGGVQMASLVGSNIIEANVDGVILRVLVVGGQLGVDGDRG